MKKISVIFILAVIFAFILSTAISANDLAYGELEGHAIQDGYIPLPITELTTENFYAPQSSTRGTKTFDDYTDAIIEAWSSCSEDTINISELNITTSESDLNKLQEYYSKILDDHPEFFYVKSSLSYYYDRATGVINSIKPLYVFEKNEIPALIEKFDSATEKALSKVDESMSDMDKMIAIHDHIVLNAEYDIETYEAQNNNHPTSFSAYGVLVENYGVCQSYTLAYSLLLKKVGIEVSTVRSRSLSHIWNLVKIDNEWYHIDVTWDDPTHDKKGLVSYKYFLASDEEFGSQGTAHYATDWVTDYTADSDVYKTAFWKKAFSTMALLDGYYYYSDGNGSSANLLRSSLSDLYSFETVRAISDLWWNYQGGGVTGGQFRVVPFAFDGELYYNTNDSIYRLCPEFETDELVYDSSITDGFIVPLETDTDMHTLKYLNVTYNGNIYVYSEEYEANLDGGHSFKSTVYPATDTEYGYTETLCPTCGSNTKHDYVNPLKYLPGDSDGDGEVTVLDAILATRILADWSTTADFDLDFNLDFDGDKKVTSLDVFILMRHLAGWVGYETLLQD